MRPLTAVASSDQTNALTCYVLTVLFVRGLRFCLLGVYGFVCHKFTVLFATNSRLNLLQPATAHTHRIPVLPQADHGRQGAADVPQMNRIVVHERTGCELRFEARPPRHLLTILGKTRCNFRGERTRRTEATVWMRRRWEVVVGVWPHNSTWFDPRITAQPGIWSTGVDYINRIKKVN